MNAMDALKTATDHVTTLANAQFHENGVSFPDMVSAVERFARILLESPDAEVTPDTAPVGTLLRDKDGDVWRVHAPGEVSYGRAVRTDPRDVESLETIRRNYGPLVVAETLT